MGVDTTIRTARPFSTFQQRLVRLLCHGGPDVYFTHCFVSPGRHYEEGPAAYRWPHNRRAILAVWVVGGFRGLDYDADINVAFTGRHTPMTWKRFWVIEREYRENKE